LLDRLVDVVVQWLNLVEGGRVRNHRRSVHHAFAASPPDLTIERIPCSLVGLPAGVQRCTSDQKPTDDQDRNKNRLPSRVNVNRRGVEDGAVEVDITGVIAQGRPLMLPSRDCNVYQNAFFSVAVCSRYQQEQANKWQGGRQ